MDDGSRIRLWPASVGLLAVVVPCACLGSLDYLGDTSAGAGASSTSGPGGSGGGGGSPCDDVVEDADNCGQCGHSCLGGPCIDSRCQPVVVAADQDGPFGIGVDDTHVYWANEGAREIRRAPKTGGDDEVLATSTAGGTEFVPLFLVVVGGQVVWSNNEAGQLDGRALMTCPTAGGPAAGFAASAPDGNSGLAADGDRFWFANFGQNDLRVADFGQDATPFISGEHGPAQVAVDETHVYWTNELEDSGGVRRAPREGGPAETLDPDVPSANGIALDADAVYVTSGTRVRRIPKQRGRGVDLDSSLFGPAGIVAIGGRVYWVNSGDGDGSTGTVKTVDAGGLEEPVELAAGQSVPVLIAADDKQIFWTNRGSEPGTGSVMRVAR
ncbi:MAG: hypothetical protein WKG00_01935 [Polyangiaceae bacterium]